MATRSTYPGQSEEIGIRMWTPLTSIDLVQMLQWKFQLARQRLNPRPQVTIWQRREFVEERLDDHWIEHHHYQLEDYPTVKLSTELLQPEVRLTWRPSAMEQIYHPPTGIYTKTPTRKVLQEHMQFHTPWEDLQQTIEVSFCWNCASPPEQMSHRPVTATSGWRRWKIRWTRIPWIAISTIKTCKLPVLEK